MRRLTNKDSQAHLRKRITKEQQDYDPTPQQTRKKSRKERTKLGSQGSG